MNELSNLLARILAAGALCAWAAAGAAPKAVPAGVCPVRTDAAPTQIDVFDGDPSEEVSLAPDDDDTGADTYTVGGVYDQGRFVTIRCHYGSDVVDVKLAKRVVSCRWSGDDRHSQIICK